MFTLLVKFRDGDSFGIKDHEEELDFSWSLETAKENLKRIKEHYTFRSNQINYISICLADREKELLKKVKEQRWFGGDERYWEYHIILIQDDGSTFDYDCLPWVGYFASLQSITVISKTKEIDSDMYWSN